MEVPWTSLLKPKFWIYSSFFEQGKRRPVLEEMEEWKTYNVRWLDSLKSVLESEAADEVDFWKQWRFCTYQVALTLKTSQVG